MRIKRRRIWISKKIKTRIKMMRKMMMILKMRKKRNRFNIRSLLHRWLKLSYILILTSIE